MRHLVSGNRIGRWVLASVLIIGLSCMVGCSSENIKRKARGEQMIYENLVIIDVYEMDQGGGFLTGSYRVWKTICLRANGERIKLNDKWGCVGDTLKNMIYLGRFLEEDKWKQGGAR